MASWDVLYDFANHCKEADARETEIFINAYKSAQGIERPGFLLHPYTAQKDTLASLKFPPVALSGFAEGERPILHFYITIADGFDPAQTPTFDGCGFIIHINGEEVFHQIHAQQEWLEFTVDLEPWRGQEVQITFQADALENSNYDWAFWGAPQILIQGRQRPPRQGPKSSMLSYERLASEIQPERIVKHYQDDRTQTIIAVMDKDLDLPALLWAARDETKPEVPLAPRMVAGEGADPENHTIVRVLNEYGIADVQFLAYPVEIKGGVQVCALRAQGEDRIVAAPLADESMREIRVFNVWGGLVNAFTPSDFVRTPMSLATARLEHGGAAQVIAVASRNVLNQRVKLFCYTADGAIKREYTLSEMTGPLELTAMAHEETHIGIYDIGAGVFIEWDLATGQEIKRVPILDATPETRVYPSAFGDELWATYPEKVFSTIKRYRNGQAETVNVGERENTFWFQWPEAISLDASSEAQAPRYIQYSTYRHIRTEYFSDFLKNPTFNTTPADWLADETLNKHARELAQSYNEPLPAVWDICFSHRTHKEAFTKWLDQKEPETGVLQYSMLTRENNPEEYVEFEQFFFALTTYAFGLPELDRLYVMPLRRTLQRLAAAYRDNPEHMAALEPNHEHEIAVQGDGSKGDYNLWMIRGFYHYLAALYGNDPAWLAAKFGFEKGQYFDAPRGWGRGEWDAYDSSNPFLREWEFYNRYVVNRRIAQTFREALLAGFPPELIRSHQIPDRYALGGLEAFSSVQSRYTPIDYTISAGVGYGFTRYGVFYTNPNNCIMGAYSSGFDNITLGEYNALTPDPQVAYEQLRYIFDHGGATVDCIQWPGSHDEGFNAAMITALRRLMEEDPPRSVAAGGTGPMRAFIDGGRAFNIVQIGAGGEHTGLLKSITSDGDWEGTVYVTPFHAHVDISSVPFEREGEKWLSAPIQALDAAGQIELMVDVNSRKKSQIQIQVLQENQVLPGLSTTLLVDENDQFIRYIFRAQLPSPTVRLMITPGKALTLAHIEAYRHTPQHVKLHRGILAGKRHKGGVTFDLLENQPGVAVEARR